MTTKFNMGRDMNGYNSFSLVFSDTNYNMLLLENVAQTITIPSDDYSYRVIFTVEPGATVWVADNTAATIPSGAAALSVSQMNPSARDILAGHTVSLITPNASAQVGVQIYAIQQW